MAQTAEVLGSRGTFECQGWAEAVVNSHGATRHDFVSLYHMATFSVSFPVYLTSPHKGTSLFIWSSSVFFSKAYGCCEQDSYTPDSGVRGEPGKGHWEVTQRFYCFIVAVRHMGRVCRRGGVHKDALWMQWRHHEDLEHGDRWSVLAHMVAELCVQVPHLPGEIFRVEVYPYKNGCSALLEWGWKRGM